MTIKHNPGERLSSAPPPSPIPTAHGSRSAVDPSTSELIEKLKKVPELILPNKAHRLASSSAPPHYSSPPDGNIIDYQWLRLKDYDAVNQVVRSAREIGTFMIYDHGIPTLDLQTISSFLGEANIENFGELSSNQCFWSFIYFHHQGHLRNVMGIENFQIFSQKIENAVRKLEEIAKDLLEVILIDQHSNRCNGSNLTILHKHFQFFDENHQANNYKDVQLHQQNSSTFALSLLLPLPPENEQLPLTSDTVFVTIGEQLTEWSLLKEYNNNTEAAAGMPNNSKRKLSSSVQQSSFSIEMRWSLSNISNIQAKIRLISLTDQLVVVIIMVLLFNILGFIC
ncbi:hypothetical protein LIER_14946 [Lithospermum erythrorhizon]|uniref:Non-haem dioxygenase N-terminal domain-containing protein n=1 Tax=Lithospermum erythrorhizon TaxID=34254 RepID=A0AAV3Q2I6_LITER